jgi:acetyl esterase/lipase
MSWQAKTFLFVFRISKWLNRNQTAEQFVESQRRFARRVAPFCQVPENCDHQAFSIGHIPCEWIVHEVARSSARVILYFHGGAYVMGGVKTHYELAAQLGEATQSKVLLVDYRLAPEYPFPAALNDAMDAYRFLLDQKYDARNIILAGDSAGGNLVLATLLKIREDRLPMPGAGVCFSPWADLTHSGESHRSNPHSDTMIAMSVIPQVAMMYAGKEALAHPLVSPLFADLHGLPPLFVNASSSEVLRDDATRLAARARKQGVIVELSIKENLPHAYPGMCRVLPEARVTIRDVAIFLKHYC